jgi:alginate O-acetyltransferase complex protein AlgI
MLFNSYFFILVFMPATLVVFFLLGRHRERRGAVAWLVAVSLFFYGWWNPAYLGLIVASILLNYTVGTVLVNRQRREHVRRVALAGGIIANLAVLGYYKYTGFLFANINAALGTGFNIGTTILPLGISFFTFTQIAYLVDAYRGEAGEYNLLDYMLFVTYFPHLIAGPILHHKEMMPQFGQRSVYRFDVVNFVAGVTYFVFGLFKKVIFADGIGRFASPVFSAASQSAHLSTVDAWGGVLSYTFQLYFDFSGYCDMAIGLALMMGIRLPLNFNSPYKACNIIDFWRRWHMTLSRFLRDYVYFSLGGNRQGRMRRYFNLFVTMLLGGLWHGAGWPFLIWGGLHGMFLAVNHAWQALRPHLGFPPERTSVFGRALSKLVTFTAVVVGWVFFRAETLEAARRLLESMFVYRPGGLSPFYVSAINDASIARWMQVVAVDTVPELVLLAALAVLAGLAFFAPNTQEIMGRYYWQPNKSEYPLPSPNATLWSPSRIWAFGVAVAAVWALLGMTQVSEFLYFQF